MKTVKFRNWECDVLMAQYANGRPAIQLMDANDGDPIATATLNLPPEECPPGCAYIKTYSENEGMLESLMDAGIVSAPIGWVKTGWVRIPLVRILQGEQA